MAWSTKKAARWAICCATCLAVDGVSQKQALYQSCSSQRHSYDRDETDRPSTACVNSGLNATCVMETSSRIKLNFLARFIRLSLTNLETISRWVINWLALNCAVTDFKTSLTIEGSTRSS